jgi:hypothetical protein
MRSVKQTALEPARQTSRHEKGARSTSRADAPLPNIVSLFSGAGGSILASRKQATGSQSRWMQMMLQSGLTAGTSRGPRSFRAGAKGDSLEVSQERRNSRAVPYLQIALSLG